MNILESAKLAKEASYTFKNLDDSKRNKVLESLIKNLELFKDEIISNNQLDIDLGIKNNLQSALIDRLTLNESRIYSMIDGIKQIISLQDPTNIVLEHRLLENGLDIKKVSVPFGTIGIIYESRPNVTIDCAALCIKSGNTCILKGGKEAFNSNKFLVSLISKSLKENNLDENIVVLANNPSREEVSLLMKAKEYVDLLIPRGSAGLIKHTVENATVPVIETGSGICHVFVDKEFNEEMATNIIINAKASRPSVCNALETLLVHKDIAKNFLSKLIPTLKSNNIVVKGDHKVNEICEVELVENYDIEYLDLILAIKIVDDVNDAIKHINTHGTKHSESIVTSNVENAKTFMNQVDAAAIYHNASTRFTDGFVFGLGAEIGISTQKMHARGPMGLKELCTYTYHIEGNGQIR